MFPVLKLCFLTKMFLLSTTLVLFINGIQCESDLIVLEEEEGLTVLVGGSNHFNIKLTEPLNQPISVNVTVAEKGVLSLDPSSILVAPKDTGPWQINVTGLEGGHVLVEANAYPPNFTRGDKAYIHVTVQYSSTWAYISIIIGWIYFFAWSISFYPQIYENFVRKSVVGLNFDFLALNIVGFALYGTFNCGLYWIPEVEEEYFNRHPRGLNPVQLNDIVFAVHATFATFLTIAQCFCYERGDQRVSTTARSILALFFIIFITCLGLALFNYIHWLDFLYDCSYIKLTITLIKYIPQAFMNFRRKSTVGWSIGNVFLDFTGGLLSMGQMIINAYNYNDWVSIFGDPTKFGLGIFSVFFDILFIIQHYVLYRNNYESIPGDMYVQAPDSDGSSSAESNQAGPDDPLIGVQDPTEQLRALILEAVINQTLTSSNIDESTPGDVYVQAPDSDGSSSAESNQAGPDDPLIGVQDPTEQLRPVILEAVINQTVTSPNDST